MDTKYTIGILHDENSESPRTSFDNLGTITYKKGSREVLGEEALETEEMEAIYNSRDYICLPVYAYFHSGIVLNTTGFSCPFDSGQSGIIYVPRQKIRDEWCVNRISPKLYERVIKNLKAEIETFNSYLAGDVWGYVITDAEDEQVDSCWGFYGRKYCVEEASGSLQALLEDAA